MSAGDLPERIRVSLGSAVVLGLTRGSLNAKPTTVYLLTYRPGKCYANCGFCPQARESRGRADMLSRVVWPPFPTKQVLIGIEEAERSGLIRRVCIQALNYPTVFDDLLKLTREIRYRTGIPISVSCQPLNRERIQRLAAAGMDRISIPLDAVTKEIFDKIKGSLVGGPYAWEKQREALEDAVRILGKGFVTTHLIAGLGETEREMTRAIQWCVDLGVYPALFAFTPIQGTPLEKNPPPSLRYYRMVQVAHYLILHGKTRYERMEFDGNGRLIGFGVSEELLLEAIRTGNPFLTSGCPDCNRPYYNERPGGPIYNYPQQPPSGDVVEIEKQIDGLASR